MVELLGRVVAYRRHAPSSYLSERRSTHNLLEDWNISQTSFSRRHVLVSLAVLIPRPPSYLGLTNIFKKGKLKSVGKNRKEKLQNNNNKQPNNFRLNSNDYMNQTTLQYSIITYILVQLTNLLVIPNSFS